MGCCSTRIVPAPEAIEVQAKLFFKTADWVIPAKIIKQVSLAHTKVCIIKDVFTKERVWFQEEIFSTPSINLTKAFASETVLSHLSAQVFDVSQVFNEKEKITAASTVSLQKLF